MTDLETEDDGTMEPNGELEVMREEGEGEEGERGGQKRAKRKQEKGEGKKKMKRVRLEAMELRCPSGEEGEGEREEGEGEKDAELVPEDENAQPQELDKILDRGIKCGHTVRMRYGVYWPQWVR